MPLLFTLLAVASTAYGFFRCVLLADLVPSFQPIIVALSIMAAAILVRLNRGMPALEWKSLLPDERISLTKAIVDLNREYLVIVASNAVSLVSLIILSAVGLARIQQNSGLATQIASGWIGGCLALCMARMVYVVWRDYDIVRLQKMLIDASARRDDVELQTKRAEDAISKMKAASLSAQNIPQPRDWKSE